MINPVFTRFRELIAEVAPEIRADDVLFDVQVDPDNVHHILDCITGTTKPSRVNLASLEGFDVCPYGLYSRDSSLPQAFTDSISDRQLAMALTVHGACDELLALDVEGLRSETSTALDVVRLAGWYINITEGHYRTVADWLTGPGENDDQNLISRARAAVDHFRAVHAGTIGHRSIRRILGVHDDCRCPQNTIAMATLPVISFQQHVSSDLPVSDGERGFALISSFCDHLLADPRGLYDLPSCVVDVVLRDLDYIVKSERYTSLPVKVRETASALWTPQTEDPYASFDTAVQAASRLVGQG